MTPHNPIDIMIDKACGVDEVRACRNCDHFTSRKSEFAGWQYCGRLDCWHHKDSVCKYHKPKL